MKRRYVSLRINPHLYAVIRELAENYKQSVGRLIENLLLQQIKTRPKAWDLYQANKKEQEEKGR